MNKNKFAQIAGTLDANLSAETLLAVIRGTDVLASIDGDDLNMGGASNLRVEFDKGINTFRSEGGNYGAVLAQAKNIATVLTQFNIKYFIEVCDDDWEEIVTFGDYGRN